MSAEPTVRPIGWVELATAACLGGAVGAVVKLALEQALGAAPAPVGTGIVLLGIAGLIGAMARAAHQRLQVKKERIRPELALRWLAFGRTAMVGGAALAAWFALWALASWPVWETPLGKSRTIWSVVAAVGAVALLVAGRWLETGMRVRPSDDEDEEETPHPA